MRDLDTLTGAAAVEALRDRWDTLGLGKVEAEYRPPYLVVGRAGADWRVFISLADDTVVLVEDDKATTRHIPEADRAEGEVPDDALTKLSPALERASGGMYPLQDDDEFGIGFVENADNKELRVEMLGDEVRIE